MKLSFIPLLLATAATVSARKGGSKAKSSGAQCYANEGFAWANKVITDGTCPYVPPSYAFPIDPEPFIVTCNASGGFNVMTFVDVPPGADPLLVPVACCDRCELDAELLAENCDVRVWSLAGAVDAEEVCVNSRYAEGLAVITGNTNTGYTFYCCGEVIG